jgi:uncharacterized membrane protein YdjX (TVP38/TMEM64 family)
MTPPRRRWLHLCVLLALVAGASAIVAATAQAFGMDFSKDGLSGWVKSLGAWGGLGIVLLMIVHSFIPFPAELVTFIAGHEFGVFWGSVYSWIGAMLGACLAFALSRYLGRDFVTKFMTASTARKLDAWTGDQNASAFLLARFIPVIAFNLINYAAGLTKVGWWTFLWTTGVGILPLTVLFVYLGERMRESTWTDWLMFLGAAALLWLAIRGGQWLWRGRE